MFSFRNTERERERGRKREKEVVHSIILTHVCVFVVALLKYRPKKNASACWKILSPEVSSQKKKKVLSRFFLEREVYATSFDEGWIEIELEIEKITPFLLLLPPSLPPPSI